MPALRGHRDVSSINSLSDGGVVRVSTASSGLTSAPMDSFGVSISLRRLCWQIRMLDKFLGTRCEITCTDVG